MRQGRQMDSFADLKILSQEDQSAHALLGKIYSALHLELVEQQLDDIGVSFPNARQIAMGDVLRLHGSRKKLADLLDTRRLKPVSYTHLTLPTICSV